jgi:hypothetical protein
MFLALALLNRGRRLGDSTMGRTSTFRLLALTGAVLLTAGVFSPVRAQDADDLKRGVARISLINGEVSVRRGDSGDWVAGVINAPLLTDDRIGTGANSRGEVQFDAANMLRFGANTELRLTQLEYGRYQMVLAHGMVTYRVLRPSEANVEIDTPNISVRPAKQGSYRIAVNEAGETEVIARIGDVEVFTPTGSQWVRAGQTLMARGTASDPEFQIVAANGADDWDRWCDNRDRMLLQSTSARNVGPGVYGAEDLDAAGTWDNVPEYGNVWHPAVASDWAPYQSGRWVWEDWYGWTWVSYDPWGWAPYHYGRWFHHDRFGWCWYPGVFGVRHYWSPALVGFFGFGRGAGVGFGFGNIGWVPLAPFEVFRPWWGRGFGREGFNRSVNITNINIGNTFRNARFNNGINAVGVHEFQNGRFNNVQRFNGSQIREAGLVRGQMPIAPSSANLRFSDRQATAIPRSNENARFFTHQQPNPVARQSFNGVGGGSPVTGSAGMVQRNSSTPAGGQAMPSQNGNRGMQNDASGSWRRFGSPSGQSGSPQSPAQAQQSSGFRGSSQSGAPGNQPGNQMMRNDRPAQSQPGNSAPAPRDTSSPRNNGGWQRFGAPGDNQSSGPRGSGMHYNAPSGGSGQNLRISPPVVRERSSSAPSYSAPRQSAPSYSAPRSNSGGGGGSRPSGSNGGGNHGGGGSSSHGGGHR